ncbi:hypothetical protein CAEBREN_21984 [Caenorhabditis brenneri]|uniref:Uncharacterized protein n=1 Tax=Caenorhabditis brenneri TaxID=135651 RepID=G0NX40_CAEBE|nr:hypothetical protein CAEBREN_21984 [Caenorhabditis brenneri]
MYSVQWEEKKHHVGAVETKERPMKKRLI